MCLGNTRAEGPVLPENAIRDLRVVAGVLRRIDVYDDRVVAACARMAKELERMAEQLEDKELPVDTVR